MVFVLFLPECLSGRFCFRQWRWLVQCPSAEVFSVYTFLALKNKSVRARADRSKWDSQSCLIYCLRILWQASTEDLALHQRNTTRKSLSFRPDLKYVEILDCSSLSCHTPLNFHRVKDCWMMFIPSSLLSSRVFTWLLEWVGSKSGQAGQKIVQKFTDYKYINLKVKAVILHFPLKTSRNFKWNSINSLVYS